MDSLHFDVSLFWRFKITFKKLPTSKVTEYFWTAWEWRQSRGCLQIGTLGLGQQARWHNIANANFTDYASLVIKGRFTHLQRVSPTGIPKGTRTSLLALLHVVSTTTRPLCCPHPTALQNPGPSQLNFPKPLPLTYCKFVQDMCPCFDFPILYMWSTKAGTGQRVCFVHWCVYRMSLQDSGHKIYWVYIVELLNLSSRGHDFRTHRGFWWPELDSRTLSPSASPQRFRFCSHINNMQK